MKKTSTVGVKGNMISKGQKLTIGLDLGDRWSFYCETEIGDDTGSDEADIGEDTAESRCPGERNTFPLGKPAVKGAGTPGARGARTKGAIDHQEQSQRFSSICQMQISARFGHMCRLNRYSRLDQLRNTS